MRNDLEISLLIDFEELFGFRDRLRPLADDLRRRLYQAGLRDHLESDLFDTELEMRTNGPRPLMIRLDSFHLAIAGGRPDVALHRLAALILDAAEAFRLTSVEVSQCAIVRPTPGQRLDFVARAFAGPFGEGDGLLLDRRFTMSWDWATETTGFTFLVQSLEDRELLLNLKAREGYLTLNELQDDQWLAAHTEQFLVMAQQFLRQSGWR